MKDLKLHTGNDQLKLVKRFLKEQKEIKRDQKQIRATCYAMCPAEEVLER